MNATSPSIQKEALGIAVIGAGGLGSALAKRLKYSGYFIQAILSRTSSSAEQLALEVGASVSSTKLSELPQTVRMVFCCVPDDAIGPVVETLYLLDHPWADTCIAHTSGTCSSEVLALPAAQGAVVMSFFPVQTFPRGGSHELFEGIVIGLEGQEEAVRLGRQIATDLGSRPIILSAEEKMRSHLAASIASNFLVTLSAMASEVLSSIGMNRKDSSAFLGPLVDQTCRNLSRDIPEDILTGPIARGDNETISRHLSIIKEFLPHLMPAYVSMASETVRVAVRGGKLSKNEARQLLDRLLEALDQF